MGSSHISPTLLRATVLRLLQPAKSELVININTASWNVLAAIPFFTPDIDPNNYTDDNLQLGIAIWQGREAGTSSSTN